MAGKGPELRKGANLEAYWDNYDSIFRKKEVIIHDRSDVMMEAIMQHCDGSSRLLSEEIAYELINKYRTPNETQNTESADKKRE